MTVLQHCFSMWVALRIGLLWVARRLSVSRQAFRLFTRQTLILRSAWAWAEPPVKISVIVPFRRLPGLMLLPRSCPHLLVILRTRRTLLGATLFSPSRRPTCTLLACRVKLLVCCLCCLLLGLVVVVDVGGLRWLVLVDLFLCRWCGCWWFRRCC